jgi:hypothetical protein
LRNKSDGRALVPLLALLFCWAPVCRAQPHPSPEGSSQQAVASQKAKNGPLSLSDVLDFLDAIQHNIASEQEVMEKLASRGLDFKADPAALAMLRGKGASDAMIEEIKKRAKREETTVTLSLSCSPPECRIKINGQPAGATSDGSLVKSGLAPGEYTIDFEKEGYITDQKTVKVRAEPGPPTSVTLEPTDATMAVNGKSLYEMMVRALGGAAILKNLRSINGSGSVTLYKDGKQSDWDFDVAMGPPHLIEMQVKGSAAGLLYGCNGEKCGEKKKGFLIFRGKKLPEAVASELEPNLRLFSRYDLVSVLETLNSKGVRLTARTAENHGKKEQHLNAVAPDFEYVLTIGTDSLPTLVEYKPRSGLGAATVTYGEYVKVGDYNYPKHTSVKLPGSAQLGIEVRLGSVELGSNLRVSDFPK